MKATLKYTTAAVLAGALALAAATPGQARDGRNTAAAVGFAAGAVVGAAAASAYNGYYYYGAPAYYSDYAYEPAPVYVQPAPRYYRAPRYSSRPGCVTDGNYNAPDYGAC